ncbi:hypothetical protein Enr10x_29750 [Gimesia panareensis]|uniref:Uncharacterized protein n=1 Tax=Gimesia panareensis TaxID=2527978 RepID=A0A517Q7P5_9PLAN|nr:hypothetical protein Enr10x_29750 [Gimesia panareensis]
MQHLMDSQKGYDLSLNLLLILNLLHISYAVHIFEMRCSHSRQCLLEQVSTMT